MAGFSNVSGDESIVYADNASFDGTERGGKITTNGQLWIGATASPHVRVGTITSTGSTITVTNSAGGINLETNGSMVGNTITGNSGGALSPSSGNWNIVTANSTIKFVGSGSTLTQDFANTNLCLGSSLPMRSSAAQNVIIGNFTGASITSALSNVIIGYEAGYSLTSGVNNILLGLQSGNLATNMTQSIGIGTSSLLSCTAGSSANNIAIGHGSLPFITTGTNNVGLGISAGSSYTSSESSNIVIGNAGVISESNAIRLGTQGSGTGQQNTCTIAGIVGVTASNPELVTVNSSTGQLGVQALTQYDILVGGASNAVAFVGPGSSGQVLQSGGASANPAYSTAKYPATTSVNQVLYSSSANVIGGITTANNSLLITNGSGVPAWGTVLGQNFGITQSLNGNDSAITITNSSNTASSRAVCQLDVAGTSAGDAAVSYSISGSTSWTHGIHNGATVPSTNPWVLSQAGILGTNDVMRCGTSGSIVMPLQPAAAVYLNTAVTNATGDGTYIQPVIFDTKLFDQQTNYSTSTGYFTCPVAGIYRVSANLTFTSVGAGFTTGEIQIIHAGSTLSRREFNPGVGDFGTDYAVSVDYLINCSATDTLGIYAVVSGSTKTVGLKGAYYGLYCYATFQLEC